VAAVWAGSAGFPWWHSEQPSTIPRQLTLQLAAEFEPALVENAFVQA